MTRTFRTLAAAAALAILAAPVLAAVTYELTGSAGFFIPELDEDGNEIFIPDLDEDGNPVFDDNGEPQGSLAGQNLILTFGFSYLSPSFLTSSSVVTPDSCAIGDGSLFVCNQITLDPGAPNTFGGEDVFIDFGFDNADLSGGGSGFLFFEAGSLGATGTYLSDGFPVGTPGFGNFGVATLTVSGNAPAIPVPAALPLLATALGGLALVRRRRPA